MIVAKEHNIKKDEFEGKVVLVTGANRGFGLAITMDLARAGATCHYARKGFRFA
jgi:NAD(P)-dependent dehydrogenase (short-subunit alcohol dehydrogenase family)